MEYRRKGKVQTPCVTVCTLDSTEDYCIGCGRKIDEIQNWCFMSDHEKLQIIKQLPARKKKLKP